MAGETYWDTYREESRELLDKLEKFSLELEADPTSGRLGPDIFRVLHTLKGTAAMFGFEAVAGFAHELESLYAGIREGKSEPSRETAELTLESVDLLRACIQAALAKEPCSAAVAGKKESLIARILALRPREAARPAVGAPGPEPARVEGVSVTYRIRFRPPENIFQKGINPEAILQELAALGPARFLALLDRVPELESLDPERCYLAWDILLTTRRGENAIRDVFIFVEDQSAITIDAIDVEREDDGECAEPVIKKLGEILIERGDLTEQALQRALEKPMRLGEALAQGRVVEKQRILSALAEQEYLKQMKHLRLADLRLSSIRVKSEKVDELINLVGELVTLQERLKTTAGRCGAQDVLLMLEENERVIERLRHDAMSMRLLAIDTIFSRYQRVVRDLAADLGKKAVLEVAGAETELDKSIIERLNDPLIHLIRNCLDHGIEPGEERTARGKSSTGRISLRAYHAEAHVFIEVEDDGRGLDRDAILATARERGLLANGDTPADEALFPLIFQPGFSTAKAVTEISGRGVGMDVVKRLVESLGGRVTVKSAFGAGTTVILKIPLTLSIIEGLFVRVADELFVIPLTNVEECVELPREEGRPAAAGRVLSIRGELLPYVRLREYFGMAGERPPFEKVVVVRSEHRIGIAVDEVVGNAQVVIKTMGGLFSGEGGVLGATVTGDGSVSLILDVGRIAAVAEEEATARAVRIGRRHG